MSHLALPVERPARNPEETGRPALVSTRQPQHALDVPVLQGAQIRDLVLAAAASDRLPAILIRSLQLFLRF